MEIQEPGDLPLVLVSLLHWNTPDCTLRCLDSLYALDYPNFQILLVDNASTDGSVAAIRSCHPQLRILRNSTNLGFAGGHTAALEHASQLSAAAIWLVNSDCVVHPTALFELVTAWQAGGAAIYGGVPLRCDQNGRQLLNFPRRFLRPHRPGPTLLRDPPVGFVDICQRQPFEVSAVPGSCMLLPLSVIESSGWMASDWFLYCEELDYCLRLRRMGVRSYLVPRSVIEHPGGGSHLGRSHVADYVVYYQTRNEIVLARRHCGRLAAGVIALKKLLRAAACTFVRPSRGRRMLLGIFDALRGRMGKTLAPEAALLRDLCDAAKRADP